LARRRMQQKNADRQADRHPPTECLVGMYARSQTKEFLLI